MMESWHRVGQKVVCVDASPHVVWPAKALCKGKVYTIREVVFERKYGVSFLLVEIKNTEELCETDVGYPQNLEPSYTATRFRPVRSTSIECFRSLLNPTPDRVREMEPA